VIYTIHGVWNKGYTLHDTRDMCGGWRKREEKREKEKVFGFGVKV
jgi:hypothetical protein